MKYFFKCVKYFQIGVMCKYLSWCHIHMKIGANNLLVDCYRFKEFWSTYTTAYIVLGFSFCKVKEVMTMIVPKHDYLIWTVKMLKCSQSSYHIRAGDGEQLVPGQQGTSYHVWVSSQNIIISPRTAKYFLVSHQIFL